MAANFSTALLKMMADSTGVRGALPSFRIRGMSGSRPTDADQALTGTTLVIYTLDASGSGLSFPVPTTGVLTKDPAAIWRGLGIAAGTLGWARIELLTDDGSLSTAFPRIDLTVGTTGADMNVGSLVTRSSPASNHSIDEASITI